LQLTAIVRNEEVLKAFLDASPNLPDPAKQLLLGCLATDPTQHLTMEKLRQHAFLQATAAAVEAWDSLASLHPGRRRPTWEEQRLARPPREVYKPPATIQSPSDPQEDAAPDVGVVGKVEVVASALQRGKLLGRGRHSSVWAATTQGPHPLTVAVKVLAPKFPVAQQLSCLSHVRVSAMGWFRDSLL
jgi:hypothetical protein